jgi:Mg2+/Co2+ transporter CorB
MKPQLDRKILVRVLLKQGEATKEQLLNACRKQSFIPEESFNRQLENYVRKGLLFKIKNRYRLPYVLVKTEYRQVS